MTRSDFALVLVFGAAGAALVYGMGQVHAGSLSPSVFTAGALVALGLLVAYWWDRTTGDPVGFASVAVLPLGLAAAGWLFASLAGVLAFAGWWWLIVWTIGGQRLWDWWSAHVLRRRHRAAVRPRDIREQ